MLCLWYRNGHTFNFVWFTIDRILLCTRYYLRRSFHYDWCFGTNFRKATAMRFAIISACSFIRCYQMKRWWCAHDSRLKINLQIDSTEIEIKIIMRFHQDFPDSIRNGLGNSEIFQLTRSMGSNTQIMSAFGFESTRQVIVIFSPISDSTFCGRSIKLGGSIRSAYIHSIYRRHHMWARPWNGNESFCFVLKETQSEHQNA